MPTSTLPYRGKALIAHAVSFAEKMHEGQFLPGTRTPYLMRPTAIAIMVSECSDEAFAAAWLIDSMSVCGHTSSSLEAEGFPRSVTAAIFLLGIGNDAESLKHVKGNPIARQVAIAERMYRMGQSRLGSFSGWDIFKCASDLHFLLMEPKRAKYRNFRAVRDEDVRPESFTEAFPKAE